MSTTAPAHAAPSRPVPGYLHDVMFWSGLEEFVGRTAEFVLEGVARGEPVLVALPRARSEAVRRAVGRRARDVRFADMESLGANPARIINAWVDFAREAGGAPSRGVGEPLWPGRREAEVRECHLHEALLNLAIGEDTPLWLRCPYDATHLDDASLVQALRGHPWVAGDRGDVTVSGTFAGALQGADLFARPLPGPPRDPVVRTVRDGDSVRAVRELVVHVAMVHGVSTERAQDLGLAAHELAINTMTHGGGTGELRLWRERGDFICEVVDGGRVDDPLAGRLPPPPDQVDGRGLWMVNHLCDLVELRSGEQGTVVRLHTWLD